MLVQFFATFFRGDFLNQGKQVYLDHVEEVRSLVPPERLLEYNIKDGWDPLCEFLGDSAPDISFPHENNTANFIQICNALNKRQMMNAVLQAFTMSSAFLATGIATAMIWKRFVR